MADDIVHRPAYFLQVGPGGLVLLLAGQFLLPPGAVVHPVHRPAGVQPPAFLLEQRIVRLQDAVLDVVAAGPAHGEEALALDVVDLTPHQVDHRGADTLHPATVPVLNRELGQHIEVLMIAGYEQGGKGLCLQPVQSVALLRTAVPDAAEVAGDHDAVILGQFRLLIENFLLEAGKIAVSIACYENCHAIFLHALF